MIRLVATISILWAFTAVTRAADAPQDILLNKQRGNAALANVVVDSAPGNVSAMSLLGISADQTSVVQNPRNLTLGLKALDGKNSFGLSITPARTSLVPMSISTYNESHLARLWAATTFSYAQGRADVNSISYERRAFSVETSYFFFPHKDDAAVRYWDALEAAVKGPIDDNNTCVLIPAQKPGSPNDEKLKADLDVRAQACRDQSAKRARWNASRAWASWASGDYQPANGGASHSLGKATVLGVTWGFGEHDAKTAAAFTVAGKHVSGAPVLKTFGDPIPIRMNRNLVTFRAAVGSPKARAILEGSNVRNETPTALDRTYKRALGLDLNIAEGLWLNFRVGKQRRIDDSGDEDGSTFTLSYSPKALLNF